MISIYRISGIEFQCPINLRIFFSQLFSSVIHSIAYRSCSCSRILNDSSSRFDWKRGKRWRVVYQWLFRYRCVRYILFRDMYIYFFPGDFFFFFVVPFRIDAQSREKVIASSKNVEFQPRRCWIVWNHDGYLSFRDRRRWKVVEIKLICIFFFQYPIHFAQVILTSLRNIRFIIGSLKKLYHV